MKMQYSSIICFYYAKISKDRTKKLFIFRISSQQMLKYIIINGFKKANNWYKVYYSYCFCNYFYRVINIIILVSQTCKD